MLRERTKEMFAEKLMEMAQTRPIHKIRVKELCAACGVERTTFYYHFHDKYELVAWIFLQYYREESLHAEVPNDEAMIRQMLSRIDAHRIFFLNALQDHEQNSLQQYMLEFYVSIERDAYMKYREVTSIDEETEYLIRQYSYGCMGHIIDWLLGKNELTVEKLAYYQYKCMPDLLKEAFTEKG